MQSLQEEWGKYSTKLLSAAFECPASDWPKKKLFSDSVPKIKVACVPFRYFSLNLQGMTDQ